MRRPIDPWRAAAALLFLVGFVATLWWGWRLNDALPCNGHAACGADVAQPQHSYSTPDGGQS